MVKAWPSIHAEPVSLGVVLWQCVVGDFPFGEATPIFSDANARKRLEARIANEDPGKTDRCEAGIAELIRQCWRRHGHLRPTGADVARILEQIYTRMSCEMTGSHVQVDNAAALDAVQSKLMERIKLARAKNPPGTKDLVVPKDLKVSQLEFETYYSGFQWDAVKSFVVGAALFWELAQAPVDDDAAVVANSPLETNANKLGKSNVFQT